MRKFFTVMMVLLGLTFADALQKDYAYVISAIGIKNVEGNVIWQSGSSNQLADGTYKLAPQVIIYDGKTEYVGAATPFTGCLNGIYYNSTGAPDGACFAGGVATSSQNGLMSAADKAKLDGINLSNYALTSHTHDDRYYTESEINTKLSNVITTDNIGSQTVNRSSSAYRAERLLINGSTYEGNFHWSGQSGQPTWLWGSNDGANMYVWNPSNFSVNYANSSGSSNYANRVWTQSHNGSWYINSNWNGSVFVTNARENGGSELPIWVNHAGNADTVDGYHASDLGMKMDLLWENGSPASSFSAQTIYLNLSGYKSVKIIFYTGGSGSGYYTEDLPILNIQQITSTTVAYSIASWNDANNIQNAGREISGITTSGVTFGNGFFTVNTYRDYNNSFGIPYRIYGIK